MTLPICAEDSVRQQTTIDSVNDLTQAFAARSALCASDCRREQFLDEFLEVGGALTVVEILSVKQAKETDKAEALKLLVCLASAGRQYKEFICEAYGQHQSELMVFGVIAVTVIIVRPGLFFWYAYPAFSHNKGEKLRIFIADDA